MSESYKISLGVELNTSDISSKIKNIKPDAPIKIDIDLNHVNAQIEKIKTQIQSLNNVKINLGSGTSTSSGSGIKNAVNDTNSVYKQMLDIQKKANSLSIKINGLDTSKNVNELRELSLQFSRLKSDYEVLKKTFGSQLSTNQFGNLQAEVDETEAKLRAMDAKIADTKAQLAKSINVKLISGDFANQVSTVEKSAKKLSGTYNEVEIGIEEVNRALADMRTASANNDMDALISANQRYEQALKTVKNQIDINVRAESDYAKAQRDTANAEILNNKKNALMSEMNSWLKENTRATAQYGSAVEKLKVQLSGVTDDKQLSVVKSGWGALKKEVHDVGLEGKTLGETFKDAFKSISTYLSAAALFNYAQQALKSMFEQVKAIDTAMTELKKVTDETDASYNKFLKNAASRAKEIGTTIDGLVESTADFARLGYGFEDAQGLAEVANIYTVVGDEIDDVSDATESLISTMAAFKDEMGSMSDADFALSIVDKFNEVDILAS